MNIRVRAGWPGHPVIKRNPNFEANSVKFQIKDKK